MARGRYLTIGLNYVDPNRYEGWDGELNACENDARDMAEMTGFTGTTLLREQATSHAVLQELHKAAVELSPGDLFVVGYSGHGSNIEDATADEPDKRDETWCLYDRMLVDDELYAMWSHFGPGVRILVLSDSCHSGTMLKKLPLGFGGEVAAMATIEKAAAEAPRGKMMPAKVRLAISGRDRALYDSLQYVAGPAAKGEVRASVLLISGCQDDQLSRDGPVNGAFTAQLKTVWDGGKFVGDYKQFHRQIAESMPQTQKPNYSFEGALNPEFEAQKPFTL